MFKSNNHKNLYVLSFGELAERFCYYGTQTIIVLYLTNYFMLSDDLGYEVFAIYAAFATILPLLGGIIADRYVNINTALITGMILILLGNAALMMQAMDYLYFGLALTLVGTGLYKSNIAVLVGRLFPSDDVQRQKGYTIFYAFINIGATAGPIVYGIVIALLDWQYCFIVNMVLAVLGLLAYLFYFDHEACDFARQPKEARNTFFSTIKASIILLAALLTVIYALYFPEDNDWLFLILAAVMLVYITRLLMRNATNYLAPMALLLFLCVCVIAFYALSLQVASSVSLFIDQYVNKQILGWEIPTIMFAALYPASVIIMVTPVVILWQKLERSNIHLSHVQKFCIGYMMLIFAFAFFCASALTRVYFADAQFILIAIVIANLFLGVGEICIVPVLLNTISKKVPQHLQGTFIGIYYIATAFGGFLSGQVAQWGGFTDYFYDNPGFEFGVAEYINQFLGLTFVAIGLFILVMIIEKAMRKFRE